MCCSRLIATALLTMSLAVTACRASQPLPNPADTIKTIGSIERLHPDLDALVAPDARLEVIAEGFEWAEGPVWVPQPSDGFLLFSDIPKNAVLKWESGKGVSTYLQPSGYSGRTPRPGAEGTDEPGSNGLMLDSQGRLVLCQHGNRQVARMEAPIDAPASRFETIADKFDGNRFNSPNDLAFHPNGDLYFTDPPYGLPQRENDAARELDYCGVYRVTPGGAITLLTKELPRPNGIAFSPDYRTLYVANSEGDNRIWMAYPVKADGLLGPGRVFFDATKLGENRIGSPDGMAVDKHGNIFATGPGGVLVFNPQGRHLGTLLTGQATANCTFGDDGRTLYITADMYLLRIRLTTGVK